MSKTDEKRSIRSINWKLGLSPTQSGLDRRVDRSRISQLPMGLGSLKHILKVELIRAEQQEQNRDDENSSLQYACAVAVLK